ncbi:Uncharacterised protein [Achromobacter xylosoxidans]|nr:Uncharacterised protein [Achromobacter xylosoxidans]
MPGQGASPPGTDRPPTSGRSRPPPSRGAFFVDKAAPLRKTVPFAAPGKAAPPPPTRRPRARAPPAPSRAPFAHQHRPKKKAARPPGRPKAGQPPRGAASARSARRVGAHISPPTVEKLEDSCGAGAKKPAVPSTCRRRSKTAQSIVWPIPGALIHRPKDDCGMPADALHRPAHLSQHSVDKHEDRMRAARLFPCTSSTCKGWSRKTQTHSPRRQVVPGKCG